MRKVYGSVGVVFKGSGFYRTDSRKAAAASETASSKLDGRQLVVHVELAADSSSSSSSSSSASSTSSSSSSGSASKAAS